MLQLSDLLNVGNKVCAQAYVFSEQEKASLQNLHERLKANFELLKPFLSPSLTNFKLLFFDVETNPENRDEVKLVGVLIYPDLEIYQYDHPLSRAELDTLVVDATIVIFAAFNYGFDLIRAFAKDAKQTLLRRCTRFGGQKVSYYVYKADGVVSYALDIMRLSSNLLNEKARSLKAQSDTNYYFKKKETEDFTNRTYNAYDLLATFELLVRCLEKARKFLEALGFQADAIVDFILRSNRNEVIESHIAPIKLFESGSRIAKILVAPYCKFPSFPAFYSGGRVRAWKVGRFKDFAYLDINSEYPSIMAHLSPNKMCLCNGKEAVERAEHIITLIRKVGAVEAFTRLYVNQSEGATLTLSSWVLVQFLENATWRVEALKEKVKKARKLMPYTLIYRNKREEQARAEGFVRFRQGMVVNVPLYFLFLQSKSQLKKIKVLDACGLRYERDEEWSKKWARFYALRKENPELSTSLKIALNACYGLLCDVDQVFSNLALAAHVTAFARTISYLIEGELKGSLIYHDTDSYICEARDARRLERLLQRLAPWGAKREYADALELVVFRTKRYAIRTVDGKWLLKGAERTGFGREKNRILSYLLNQDREPKEDIRQVTKQSGTPNIPAVRKLLRDAETGEWCFYFSYPLPSRVRIRRAEEDWYLQTKAFLDELETGGWGEMLTPNRYIRSIAQWSGFLKQPSKKLPRSQWFLELFEHLRAYGFATKQDIYNLIKSKKGYDLAGLEAQILTFEFEQRVKDDILDAIGGFENVVYEITKGGRIYFASKLKEPLEELASRLYPISPAKLKFEASKTENDIPVQVFAPLLGKPDTTFLEAQISQATLLHLPLDMREKMRLVSRTIGKLGKSDNYGVKLAVEMLDVKKDQISEKEAELVELPKKARKRSPFSQRRFYVIQRFPYKVRYHVSWDAINWQQAKRRKFIFRQLPLWLPSTLIQITQCFLHDIALLQLKMNEALEKAINEVNDIIFKWLYKTQGFELKVVPYARYCRFDIAYDIPPSEIRQRIEEFEDICDQNEYDFRKGLGFIGLNGRVISDSKRFVPGNIVLYDRNRRFDLRRHEFLRRFRPFVETWQNDPVGRLEIQCFAHRSNNRKANPLASLLNVLELYRLQAPKLYEYVERLLSVITNMLRDPPSGGSGAPGKASMNSPNSNPIQSETGEVALFFGFNVLAGFGVLWSRG